MINLSYLYPAFCLVSTKNVPIFANDTTGPLQTRLKHDCLFICLLRHCRKCSTVENGLFFFFLSSVPCVGEESVLMGLHWLPAGQRATRVDFKTHSDTFKFFIARLPYNYVLIREPLSYYRPGENLLSLQTLIDHIVFLTLKFMSIVPFPLLLQNC